MGITVEAPFRIKNDEFSDTDRLCKKKTLKFKSVFTQTHGGKTVD